MRKLTLGLLALLASLTMSQANIGETLIGTTMIGKTMKEALALSAYYGWKPIQFHDCPAVQSVSVTNGTSTLIYSPKTNREIASIFDSQQGVSVQQMDTTRKLYGQWQLVQDTPKLTSWHLKHPRLGDLWMVSTANAHVLIVATPEGLEKLGLHAAKSP